MKTQITTFGQRDFNTLAQSRTSIMTYPHQKPEIIVRGQGTDLIKTNNVSRRAKKKMITQKLILALIKVAERKGKQERAKAYRNTYYCQSRIYSSGSKIYGNYCKNRFCLVCSGIRKADIINKYLPIIEQWTDAHFLTLTAKAVPANILAQRMQNMLKALRIILDRNQKRVSRHTSEKLIGLRSLESNFNPETRTYNPHFHLLVSSEDNGLFLLKEWESLWTNKGDKKYSHLVSMKGQDMQKVYNPESCLVEIVKYFSKIFTYPDPDYKDSQKTSPYIYASALDNIIWAMKGHRIFDRFGFNQADIEPQKERERRLTVISDFEKWNFEPKQNDWVNADNPNEVLMGYKPTSELINLLTNNINTTLE